VSAATLTYVVLRHDGIPAPHYDLMFETSPGSALATWRLLTWPVQPGAALIPLPNHRRAYLTYEGAVTGGRGTVRRVASGLHEVIADGPDGMVVRLIDGGGGAGMTLRLPRTPAAAAEELSPNKPGRDE
jgi:hypothetical protein